MISITEGTEDALTNNVENKGVRKLFWKWKHCSYHFLYK